MCGGVVPGADPSDLEYRSVSGEYERRWTSRTQGTHEVRPGAECGRGRSTGGTQNREGQEVSGGKTIGVGTTLNWTGGRTRRPTRGSTKEGEWHTSQEEL